MRISFKSLRGGALQNCGPHRPTPVSASGREGRQGGGQGAVGGSRFVVLAAISTAYATDGGCAGEG